MSASYLDFGIYEQIQNYLILLIEQNNTDMIYLAHNDVVEIELCAREYNI